MVATKVHVRFVGSMLHDVAYSGRDRRLDMSDVGICITVSSIAIEPGNIPHFAQSLLQGNYLLILHGA